MFKRQRNFFSLPPIDPKTAEDFNKKHRIKILAWAGCMLFGVLFWFFLCMIVIYW
jgi:hypothetical protein